MIVRRGFRRPIMRIDRLRAHPPAFRDVILSSFGAMPDFADRIDTRDRLGDRA
jgi:hypothetical protein